MSNVVARTIFNTTLVERTWKNYVTSGVVHAAMIAAAFLIAVPAVQVMRPPVEEHVTLIAPVIPNYHSKIELPRVTHQPRTVNTPVLPPVAKNIPPQIVPNPVVKQTPAPIVPAPVIARMPEPEPKIVAEAKPELPPAPKPLAKTGSFEDLERAKAAPVKHEVLVGGFGDPRGAHTNDASKTVLLAKVGNFDSPAGNGQTGGGGRLDSGSVKQSGFGSAGIATGTPNSNGKGSSVQTGNFGDGSVGGAANGNGHGNMSVKTTGFGDKLAAAPAQRREVQAVPAFTPIEILFKPRPSYSLEARNLRLEGQVSLEVVFQASGAVKVVRIIKGLGHGLDEAAQQAATQVRFKPATKSGAPVDTSATISITFELT